MLSACLILLLMKTGTKVYLVDENGKRWEGVVTYDGHVASGVVYVDWGIRVRRENVCNVRVVA
jgi:hypothetical protein